jgi:hypothetical protein
MWADSLVPWTTPATPTLEVRRDVIWWIAAAIIGGAYIIVLGPGLQFTSAR